MGDDYEVQEKQIDGYKIIEEEKPTNATGQMAEENIVVNYYYKKVEAPDGSDEPEKTDIQDTPSQQELPSNPETPNVPGQQIQPSNPNTSGKTIDNDTPKETEQKPNDAGRNLQNNPIIVNINTSQNTNNTITVNTNKNTDTNTNTEANNQVIKSGDTVPVITVCIVIVIVIVIIIVIIIINIVIYAEQKKKRIDSINKSM